MTAPLEKPAVRLVAYVLDESHKPLGGQQRWVRQKASKWEGAQWMPPESEAEFFDGDALLAEKDASIARLRAALTVTSRIEDRTFRIAEARRALKEPAE